MPRKPPAGAGESEPAKYRREAARLRPLVDAQLVLGESAVIDYFGTLGCVYHAAHYGVHRPSVMNEAPESGRERRDPANRAAVAGSKRTSGEYATGLSKPIGESKPPSYDHRAMALFKAELRHLAKREETLLAKLDAIIDGKE